MAEQEEDDYTVSAVENPELMEKERLVKPAVTEEHPPTKMLETFYEEPSRGWKIMQLILMAVGLLGITIPVIYAYSVQGRLGGEHPSITETDTQYIFDYADVYDSAGIGFAKTFAVIVYVVLAIVMAIILKRPKIRIIVSVTVGMLVGLPLGIWLMTFNPIAEDSVTQFSQKVCETGEVKSIDTDKRIVNCETDSEKQKFEYGQSFDGDRVIFQFRKIGTEPVSENP